MTPAGKVTALYSFDDKADGAFPAASLFQASNGNFYGGTEEGGDDNCNGPYGCGVIFVMSQKAASEAALEDSTQAADHGSRPIIKPLTQPLPLNSQRVAPF
jgi:hypothetical protein